MNMFLDGPASATVLPLSRRVLSIPRTSLGKWSMWLLAAFVLLFCVFIAVSLTLDAAGIPVGTFRYWLILVPLISAVVSAVAAGVVALVAIFRRERSILMLLPLLVAAFVLFWTIGEMTESKPSTRSSTAQQPNRNLQLCVFIQNVSTRSKNFQTIPARTPPAAN